MNQIAVVGMWHLGSVTAACLCKAGYQVIAYDPDKELIANLKKGISPLFEPNLDNLLTQACALEKLKYTNEPSDMNDVDVIWITFDTPVDNNDLADVSFFNAQISLLSCYIKNNAIVLISSQVPVGTTKKLQQNFALERNICFAYIPENLRLGKAIDIFMHPDRIVIGLDNLNGKKTITQILNSFCDNLIWMSIASAEMTKHAINSFLALSVTFINEIASLCEAVGANGYEVEQGLKSEKRIGKNAYLHPGDSIAGGTLMRDVNFLTQLGLEKDTNTQLISAILKSNRIHETWVRQKLLNFYGNLNGKKISILGLTYTSHTNTLRRSSAIETCKWLFTQGCEIVAFDPAIKTLPAEYAQFIQIQNSFQKAIQLADAIVIATAWPQFCCLTPDEFIVDSNKKILVLDPNGCIAKNIQNNSQINYHSVGHSQCN